MVVTRLIAIIGTANSEAACSLCTAGFDAQDSLLELLASDEEFYLESEFVTPDDASDEKFGFEIPRIISPTEIRAWINPEINRPRD